MDQATQILLAMLLVWAIPPLLVVCMIGGVLLAIWFLFVERGR